MKKSNLNSEETAIAPISSFYNVNYRKAFHVIKWILFLLLLFFMYTGFSFFTCNDEASISKQHYNFAQKALEITDRYLANEISAIDAYYLTSDLCDNIKYLPDDTSDAERTIEHKVDINLKYAFVYVFDGITDEHYQEILQIRNELSEIIGE